MCVFERLNALPPSLLSRHAGSGLAPLCSIAIYINLILCEKH